MSGLDDAALQAELALAKLRADPIAVFRFKSEATKKATKALSTHREVYLRSGNRGGKTHWFSRIGVALARGKTEIDGVALPLLGTPNVGAVLSKGREMAKESVIKAYRDAIGTWPHHVEKNGNNIAAIWVKPDRSRSEDWVEWSCIRFFVEDGQSLAGMRLDWAHADEPPKEDEWRELRMRGKANRHFVRAITATPLKKAEWKWLREDYKGCKAPEGKGGKIEFQMSVYDNKALSAEDIKNTEEESKGPLQAAKLYGEYVDTTGSCPFDADGLKRWRERCVPPRVVHDFFLSNGNVLKWEEWESPDKAESYMVVADPSAGIEDEAGEHDPCEVVVVSRGVKGRPAVVARYNGYIPAYELGRLSTHLAQTYNNGLLVWENNSGYGEPFYLGTDIGKGRKYGNVYIEHHLDRRHLPLAERLGWTTTATTRGAIIGAMQKAVIEDGLLVYSEGFVDSLENVVVKRDGIRMEAGAGAHDESMIVGGIACHLLETYPFRSRPAPPQSEQLVKSLGATLRPTQSKDPFATQW